MSKLNEAGYPDRPTKGEGSMIVDLGPKRKRKLEDEALRRSRKAGTKIFMSDISRLALDRELSDPSA